MDDAPESSSSEDETVPTPIQKKTVGPTKKAKRQPKYKLLPSPIEQVTEFNIAQYIKDLPCGLSVGQAAKYMPKYRSGLTKAT